MRRRSYKQYCGLAHALDIVGERWTLLVVRNLLLGPLRYTDLLRGLPGITTNLLAKRLQELEAAGVIERVRASAADMGGSYRLTALGAQLEPAIHALGSWGWNWMQEPQRGELRSFEFLLVALRRRFRGGVTMRAELVADDVPYRMLLSRNQALIVRGGEPNPELRLRGTGKALSTIFLQSGHDRKPPAGVEVEGSRELYPILAGAFGTSEFTFGLARAGAA